jgi:signal peptidase
VVVPTPLTSADRPADPAASRVGRALRGLVSLTASAILAAAVLGFLGLAVGPHLLGYRTLSMLTGSMSPTIRPGDVLVDSPEPISELRVGQVVTYHIPVYDHHVESHRVTAVHPLAGGGVVFTTKGDANHGADPWTAVSRGPTVWRERAVVPGAGTVIRFVRQPDLVAGLRWGAPAVAVAAVLALIWTRKPGPDGGGGDVGGRPAPGSTG